VIDTSGVPSFEHAYTPADLSVGRGAVDELDEALARHGVERALVVCGSNVGANDDLMGPLRAGLGDRLAGVFDGTTPEKDVMAAYEALDRLRGTEADGLVAVGGGSSLDVAKATRLLAAEHRRPATLEREAERTGVIGAPADADLVPAAVVPTTFAGADLSIGGSVSFPDGPRAGLGDRRLMPDHAVYDPDLFETTPPDALRGSAMNGFDKGVESCYGLAANPVVHATAVRGLRYLADGLPDCLDDGAAMERAVVGVVLVQYGISRPHGTTLGPIHAFGHTLRGDAVQQGEAHAIAAPHVVDAVLAADRSGLDRLAEGLGVASDPASVVAAVRELRDTLGLPSRLRDVDGPSEAELDAVAAATADDEIVGNGPPGFDPTVEALRALLDEMW
jgi:alcohol dehydrogenase class IV